MTETESQLHLWNRPEPPRRPESRDHAAYRRPLTLAERFWQFHEANPHVLTAIVAISRDLKARGFRTCGMKLIFERLRWLAAIQTRNDGFRLNNSFSAFYARVVQECHEDLRGFFRLRESAADQG